MFSRYVDTVMVFLLVCVALLALFASGLSIAGIWLILFFLLILRFFILSFIKQLHRYKRVKKARQKLQAMGEKVTPTNLMSTEILYEAAKNKLYYELGSIVVTVLFILFGVLTVDWENLFANFLRWCNN